MLDAKRYRSDYDCIVENYQLLRLEKSSLAAKEQAARAVYLKYKNNNKILNYQLGKYIFDISGSNIFYNIQL